MTEEKKSFFEDMPRSMPIEDLLNKLEELFEMDTINLDKEALQQTKLFFEIQRLYIDEGRCLGWIADKEAEIVHMRRRYYQGNLPQSAYVKEPLNPLPLKTDVDKFLKADRMVLNIRRMLADAEVKTKLCEDSLKRVRDRGFDIKNAITWRMAMEQI